MPNEELSNDKLFEKYCSILKQELSYVEDRTFSWDDVVSLLIIKLRNTDSLNKARHESHATQIQLTAERKASEGTRKTEDFFPTLTLNSTFKSWKISVPTRINYRNIDRLSGTESGVTDNWGEDSIQIRRRILNDDGHGNGNPTLHICYGRDLAPVREQLGVDDYLVLVKRKKASIYEAFGVKGSVDLGSEKKMYTAANTSSDDTVFSLGSLIHADNNEDAVRLDGGTNILLYGVPGSGKSYTIEHEYCKPGTNVERVVFHPDYTNADFVGQILPVVDPIDKQVTYEFTPGPFTIILRDAYSHPQQRYILVIEEINRGNAPAIFGDVFQLLDRTAEAKTIEGIIHPVGTSEYGITNADVAKVVYGDQTHKVRIPSNLSILGTMNTSDQNVFTLDTAFQRRWRMRLIENNFNNVRASLANAQILDTNVTWQHFCEIINAIIIGNSTRMASSEDKRLGVYFVHENELTFDNRAIPSKNFASLSAEFDELLRKERLAALTGDEATRLGIIRDAVMHNSSFPEKVIKYLWDDAFKFNHEVLFDTDYMESLEDVIRVFVYSAGPDRFKIFKASVQQKLYPFQP